MRLDYIIDHQDVNMRLDDFFYKHHVSKRLLKETKMRGKMLVNGEEKTVRYHTELQDHVSIIFPQEESTVIPVAMPLSIVYEDEDLMIIEKPANIACIPTRLYLTSSLANGIMAYYQKHHIQRAIHFVNRLDKETSGLMMVAKSRYIHECFASHIKSVKRVYHALVAGHPEPAGVIEGRIARVPGHGTKRMVDPSGVSAKTYYRVLKEVGDNALVECVLETGRTHQIRVHMASIGHALIGDPLYSDQPGTFYLDSVEIAFTHPMTHEKMNFKKTGTFD